MSFLDKARPVAPAGSATTPAPSAPVVSSTGTPTTPAPVASVAPTAKPLSFEHKVRYVTSTADAPEEDKGSFLGGLVRAPLTMLARPIQAIAELGGAEADTVDRVTKKFTGGLVAPVPRSGADVKKDIGRAAETVALGLGPVAGGAAFGAGNSLEQGNDLFSTQTAFQTVLGAAGGKVLDLVGKPLLDGAGKVIGKITPDTLKEVAGKGAAAIEDFAANHNILPEAASKAINTGADKIESIANKPFSVAGDLVKKPFIKTPENIISGREKELHAIENNYAKTRKAMDLSKDAGSASRRRVASEDIWGGAVDENGLVRTKQPGGAIDQYRAKTVDQVESVVRDNLKRLNEKVSLDNVERELTKSVRESGLEGADLVKAVNGIKKEISGYALKADKDGMIPVVLAHDAKISTTKGINYMTPPEVSTYRKAVARGLKKTVEKYSKFNTEEVNKELSKFYEDIKLLERLDGSRVKGGKLGKYFAQISGNIVGGAAGAAIGGPVGSAAGTVIGGELAGRIKGSMLERTLEGTSGYTAPKNAILEKALTDSKLPPIRKLNVKHAPSEFVDPKNLPVIDFGKPLKKPKSKLPIIK